MNQRDVRQSPAVFPILRCGLRSDCGPEVSALGGASAGVFVRYTSHGSTGHCIRRRAGVMLPT